MIPFKLDRKVEIRIQSVESVPCSIVGNTMVITEDGSLLREPWDLPWPMDWVSEALEELAKEKISISQTFDKTIVNREEPDQTIYVTGRSYIPLTVNEYFEKVVEAFPWKEVLVSSDGRIRLTYEQMRQKVEDLARGLLSAGAVKGDRIALLAVNSPESVIMQFAVSKIGGVFVPLSIHDPDEQIQRKLKQVDASTFVVQGVVRDRNQLARIQRICPAFKDSQPDRLQCKVLPDLKRVITFEGDAPGAYTWKRVVEMGKEMPSEALSRIAEGVSIDDTTYILFTSGTSGEPKGVMLSHRNVLENAYSDRKSVV